MYLLYVNSIQGLGIYLLYRKQKVQLCMCVCVWGGASQVALVVKNPSANSGDIRDVDSIPRSGRFPGSRHGNPLQCSCLDNPVDRGVWQVMVHGVTESDILHMHTCVCMLLISMTCFISLG